MRRSGIQNSGTKPQDPVQPELFSHPSRGKRTPGPCLFPTKDSKNEDGIRLYPQKPPHPQNLWEYSVQQLLVARGSTKKLHGASQNKMSLGKFFNPSQRLDFAFSISLEKGAPSAAGLGWDLEPEPGL